MKELRVVSKNVVNKRVHNEIQASLQETFASVNVKWESEPHRKFFVEVIEDFLGDLVEAGEVVQYKVVCDDRNNPNGFSGVTYFVFEIEYKRPHCLNMTTLRFEIPTDTK